MPAQPLFVSAVSIFTGLFTTSRYYKETRPHRASGKMLVNPEEFNNGLPASGSRGRDKLSVREHGVVHIKTALRDNMRSQKCPHKQPKNIEKKYGPDVPLCSGRLSLSADKSKY